MNTVVVLNGTVAREGNAANARVSVSLLWGISRQEHVQWNGIVQNSRLKLPGDQFEYGALGRKAGEVMGVFGEVIVARAAALGG